MSAFDLFHDVTEEFDKWIREYSYNDLNIKSKAKIRDIIRNNHPDMDLPTVDEVINDVYEEFINKKPITTQLSERTIKNNSEKQLSEQAIETIVRNEFNSWIDEIGLRDWDDDHKARIKEWIIRHHSNIETSKSLDKYIDIEFQEISYIISEPMRDITTHIDVLTQLSDNLNLILMSEDTRDRLRNILSKRFIDKIIYAIFYVKIFYTHYISKFSKVEYFAYCEVDLNIVDALHELSMLNSMFDMTYIFSYSIQFCDLLSTDYIYKLKCAIIQIESFVNTLR